MRSGIALVVVAILTAVYGFAEDRIVFNQSIRPIFTKHCTACHGGVKEAGDVSFVTPEAIVPPDGWIVEPGDPDKSVLIERVESADPDTRMPPPDHGAALTDKEIQLLRTWIAQGAKWQGHWAYEKPIEPIVPEVRDGNWPLQPLDRFVLARLEQEQITPSEDASPERWLRRVTLDLTGLPPTLQQRADFLSAVEQHGQEAFQSVVDQLLQRQSFGERWASVWLDQIRYADSRGLGLDARRNVWKYRDWVVDALNDDMPYSDFTVKQLAGDLLPDASVRDHVATAAHRLTQTNQEGGTDDEEFRIAAVLDRVNTTWQVWQGVTFGCTQCHNHPYDPFKHKEYYQFAAFFNNTRDSDLGSDWPNIQAPLDRKDEAKASALDQAIQKRNDVIWRRERDLLSSADEWLPITKMSASTNNDTKITVQQKRGHAEYHTVDTVSRNTQITLEAKLPASLRKITAIRFTGLPLEPEKARSDSEWGFVLSHFKADWVFNGKDSRPISIAQVIGDDPNPYHNPQDTLNPKSSGGFSAYSRIHHPRSAVFVLDHPHDVPEHAKLRLTIKNDVFELGAFPIVVRRGHVAVSQDQRLTDAIQDEFWKSERDVLAKLKKDRREIASTSVPVMRERPKHLARPSHVFIRGLFLTKGDEVDAGTPSSMPPLASDTPVDRLALANWLTSTENPLTARVAVNRIWARLFGVGIVATEEDFGSSGARPSHPKLLDHLALRFQNQHGLRLKRLIKELVLSRTYRQGSVIRPELQERDADNRLLWRGPRQRLPAEMIRDQSLAFAGLLSEKMGGPPVHPPIPEGVWRPFVGDKWDSPKVGNADRYRRSIYTYTKRSIPYPMFATFDSPSREFCAPRRLRSNTPLQALMTLNDETFVECANGLAKRMTEAADDERDQIKHGFLIVTNREPASDEVDVLVTLSQKYDDRADAMKAVARILLNLDEVLSK